MCPQICIKFKCSLEGQEKREREGANIRSSSTGPFCPDQCMLSLTGGHGILLGDKLPRVGYWTTDLMVSYTISYGVLVCRKSQKLSPNKTKHLKSVFISICPIYFSYQKRVNKYCCAY